MPPRSLETEHSKPSLFIILGKLFPISWKKHLKEYQTSAQWALTQTPPPPPPPALLGYASEKRDKIALTKVYLIAWNRRHRLSPKLCLKCLTWWYKLNLMHMSILFSFFDFYRLRSWGRFDKDASSRCDDYCSYPRLSEGLQKLPELCLSVPSGDRPSDTGAVSRLLLGVRLRQSRRRKRVRRPPRDLPIVGPLRRGSPRNRGVPKWRTCSVDILQRGYGGHRTRIPCRDLRYSCGQIKKSTINGREEKKTTIRLIGTVSSSQYTREIFFYKLNLANDHGRKKLNGVVRFFCNTAVVVHSY